MNYAVRAAGKYYIIPIRSIITGSSGPETHKDPGIRNETINLVPSTVAGTGKSGRKISVHIREVHFFYIKQVTFYNCLKHLVYFQT